jgi:hypothetical protein
MSANPQYDHYLRSDCWWKQVRQCCLERAKYTCEAHVMTVRGTRLRCSQKATEAHHLTYVRIGRELPEDLMAVCASCHRRLHNRPARRPVAANDNQLQLPWFRCPGKVELG